MSENSMWSLPPRPSGQWERKSTKSRALSVLSVDESLTQDKSLMDDVLRFKSTGETRELLEAERAEWEELDSRVRAHERLARAKRQQEQQRKQDCQLLRDRVAAALAECERKDASLAELEALQVKRNRQIAQVQEQVSAAARTVQLVEEAQQRRQLAEQALSSARQEALELREAALRPKHSPEKGVKDEALRVKRSELEDLRQLQQEGLRLRQQQQELADSEAKLARERAELAALEAKVVSADPQQEERELRALEQVKATLERKRDYLCRGA